MVKASKETDSSGARSEAELRAERRAAALRANLHRRKAQARQRTDDPAGKSEKDSAADS
ncbi:hypothetical protein [Nisaea sp.]|uniref:hypothetical protein n=1 Tax=Nisaea sp. TaxID=2024842 RepID=UPI003B5257EE